VNFGIRQSATSFLIVQRVRHVHIIIRKARETSHQQPAASRENSPAKAGGDATPRAKPKQKAKPKVNAQAAVIETQG